MTHNDRDCNLWVESEERLSPKSQQFGPWLKAVPFVPTRRFMVKVPKFFASKKYGASTANSRTAKKLPVVVVRTGKPSLEIIRFEKENPEAYNREDIVSDFQEVYQLNSRLPTDEGIMEDLMLQQTESAESFEEVLGRLIRK